MSSDLLPSQGYRDRYDELIVEVKKNFWYVAKSEIFLYFTKNKATTWSVNKIIPSWVRLTFEDDLRSGGLPCFISMNASIPTELADSMVTPWEPGTVCWIGVKVAVLCAQQYMSWNIYLIKVLNNFWYFEHPILTMTYSEAYLKHNWRNCLWKK